jgi:putative transposase
MSVPRVTVPSVKQVVQLRMMPTDEQASALRETLHTCNEAASWLSEAMHAAHLHRKHDLQKRFYAELKQRFGLSAQPAIRVIGKVADAYASLRANITAGNCGPPGSERRRKIEESPIVFRPLAAQPFDSRCLSWQFPDAVGGREATVSVWTVAGRLKNVPIMADPKQLMLLCTCAIGETDLIHGTANGFCTPRSRHPKPRWPSRATGFLVSTWASSTSPPPALVRKPPVPG